MIFRTDVPFRGIDPQASGSTSVSGLGDVSARLGGQVWARPAFTALVQEHTAQMQQMLANLVRNAQDAMPNGGELRITLSRVEAQSEGRALPLSSLHASSAPVHVASSK